MSSVCDEGFELFGRSGDLKTIERIWYVRIPLTSDQPEEDAIQWIVDNTPDDIGGKVRTSASVRETDGLPNEFEVTVEYAAPGYDIPELPPAETGSTEYRFNFQAQSVHVQQSLSTIKVWNNQGDDITQNAAWHSGSLNMKEKESGVIEVEGLDLTPGPEVFTFQYYPVNATITPAYQDKLQRMCGKVNSVDYLVHGMTFAQGSLQLIRCQGGKRSADDWQIEFGFSYIPGGTFSVGPITVVKEGFDYFWAFWKYTKAEDMPTLGDDLWVQPAFGFLERVWERADFKDIGLPEAAP